MNKGKRKFSASRACSPVHKRGNFWREYHVAKFYEADNSDSIFDALALRPI